MKKISILLCILAMPAFGAAKRCVKLDPETTTCTPTNPTNGNVDWTATCTTKDNETIPILGIAACGMDAASDVTEIAGWKTTDSMYVYNSDEESTTDIHIAVCRCRIIYPVVSAWVAISFGQDPTYIPEPLGYGPNVCLYRCSYACANRGGTFYEALLTSAAKSQSDTECPAGYIGIDEPTLKIEETCTNETYVNYTPLGDANSCLDDNPGIDCVLYGEKNTSYNDDSGAYEFNSMCVME